LPALIRASKLIKRRGNAQTHGPVEPFDPPVLLDCIKRLKAGRPEDILLAAIQRRAVKVTKGEGDVPISIMPDDGGIRDIVHYIYKYIKRGIREPQQPFLRFSNREEQQNLLQIDRHPFPPGERLQVSDEGCVLITSDCHRQDPERSKSTICAYLVNEYADSPPKRDVLANVIRVTYQKHDVYHTTQDNGTSNINNITFTKRKTKTKKKFSNSVPWNLKDTYGMFGDGLDFVNFILHLGGRAPGIVPRAFNDSGSYLHKRMIRPWEDPRRICNGTRYQKRLFMRYKLLTLEIWYWRTVAKELSNNGGTCCICCAKLGEKDKCRDCQKALDDWERPEWYRNALLGKTPMRCKDVKMTGLGDRRSNSSSLPKDEDWREYLEAYPNLNDRFYNERMLLNQWKTFEIWRSEREEASQILSEKKRKRP
jgi:hypothetical protein